MTFKTKTNNKKHFNSSSRNKLGKFFKFAIVFVFLFSVIVFQTSIVFGRTISTVGSSYSGTIFGGEGWVTIEMSRNNVYYVRSDVDLDINIMITGNIRNNQLIFDLNNTNSDGSGDPISITISTNEFGSQHSRNRYRGNGRQYQNRWGATVNIQSDSEISSLLVGAISSEDLGVSDEDVFALFESNQDDWTSLETNYAEELNSLSVESGIIATNLNDIAAEESLEFSIFESSLDPLIIVGTAMVAILILGFTIVMSKTDYRKYLMNRIAPRNTGVHRLSMQEVLENENRNLILDAILDSPGIHFNELLRRTELSPGNLVWHLDILENYKIIGKKNIGQFLVYYPYYDKNPISLIDIKMAKSKVTMQVLFIVETEPGTYTSKIARKMDMDHKTIKYHVDKLLKVSLIEIKQEGRRKCLFPKMGEIKKLNIDLEAAFGGQPEGSANYKASPDN